MHPLLPIGLWFAQIPNLAVYILAGIVAGVVSAAIVRLIGHSSGGDPGYQPVDPTGVSSEVRTREFYASAWRDRRRRFFVFKLAQLSFFAFIPILWVVSRVQPYVSGQMVLLVFVAWFTAYIAAGIWLNRFRCPRCGRFYYWRQQWKGSAERQKRWRDCHWCGLHQDQYPVDGPSDRAAASQTTTGFGHPSITVPPNPGFDSSLQVSTPRTIDPENQYGALILGLVALLVLMTGLGLVQLYEYHLQVCPAFSTAVDLAARSASARAALGSPIHVGFEVHGVVHDNQTFGYAILTIPVHGPAGKGLLYVVANRDGTNWDIERAVLRSDGGSRRIDLTPPVRPERFRYPARGHVYLLPLDKAAAFSLRGLPPYFQKRLRLNVALLPPRPLPADAVNPKTKQVIAEKALNFIAKEHPEIANDLDSVILGVTSQDMTIWTSGWKFATNYRVGRLGIVSTARLHGMPWFAGPNPEVFAIRVRKMVTKNVALLEYPVQLSADVTSALSDSTFTTTEVDEMGERFEGERGKGRSDNWNLPCVTITQGPGEKQSVRVGCESNPPADSRFEMFTAYPGIPLFEVSRTDFSLPSYAFVRKYRTQDDRSRAFGIGAADSFDIFPVGDSQTFSEIELVLADGGGIQYTRTSPGTSVVNAKLSAGSYLSSPFSFSTLAWNADGWDLATHDGWTYRFPASGPDKTWQQGALIGIRSGSGKVFSIQRDASSDLRRITAPGGETVTFTCDASHRILSAKESSGRRIEYEYDTAGRLVHVHDSQNGDEYYQYDPANRLTAVLNGQHHPLLINTYGFLCEIRSQTLADGRKLVYETGYDDSHRLDYLKLTLPNRYTIAWSLTRYGFVTYLPAPPLSAGARLHP